MIKFLTPKRVLASIDLPLADYTIEELRTRTCGDKPYSAVDAALLLHEARIPKIPGDDALRDLAWIMQVMRPPMRRRGQPQGERPHDWKPISRRELARCLDMLHPWWAPAYRSAFVRLLLERTCAAAVTTAAIQQCLSPSPSRRKAATKAPRHRHA
jgi:hypothetical protein